MKDLFSAQAESYVKYRPDYPAEVYRFIMEHLQDSKLAWDCATGNGQVARELADYFEKVYATDLSQNQLNHAFQKTNIEYKLEQAEHSSFPDHYFDLIMVAQAVHWFDFDRFYKEVYRTLKVNGLLVLLGYGLIRSEPKINGIVNEFYSDVLGRYWDEKRRYIDEHYSTIPFPFKELITPTFSQTQYWTYEQFIGYLQTWSALQSYIRVNNSNPISILTKKLDGIWPEKEIKMVQFPIFLRLGKLIQT